MVVPAFSEDLQVFFESPSHFLQESVEQWRMVRFMAGEALTPSESDLQIHEHKRVDNLQFDSKGWLNSWQQQLVVALPASCLLLQLPWHLSVVKESDGSEKEIVF